MHPRRIRTRPHKPSLARLLFALLERKSPSAAVVVAVSPKKEKDATDPAKVSARNSMAHIVLRPKGKWRRRPRPALLFIGKCRALGYCTRAPSQVGLQVPTGIPMQTCSRNLQRSTVADPLDKDPWQRPPASTAASGCSSRELIPGGSMAPLASTSNERACAAQSRPLRAGTRPVRRHQGVAPNGGDAGHAHITLHQHELSGGSVCHDTHRAAHPCRLGHGAVSCSPQMSLHSLETTRASAYKALGCRIPDNLFHTTVCLSLGYRCHPGTCKRCSAIQSLCYLLPPPGSHEEDPDDEWKHGGTLNG